MRILLLAAEPGADRGGGAGRHRGLPTNRTVDAVEHLVAAGALHDVACRPGPEHPHDRAGVIAGGEGHDPRLRREAPCLGRDDLTATTGKPDVAEAHRWPQRAHHLGSLACVTGGSDDLQPGVDADQLDEGPAEAGVVVNDQDGVGRPGWCGYRFCTDHSLTLSVLVRLG